MTYKEFKYWCEDNGYDVTDNEEEIYVSDEPLHLCSVSKKYRNSMDTTSFGGLPEHLFRKVIELANTPLRERDETKRYIVKIPAGRPDAFCAVAKDGSNLYMYDDSDPDLTNDYKLTEKQIKEIDERFMAFAEEIKE